MAQKDVFKILDDIRKRALNISDTNLNGTEGFMVSFLPTGFPINKEDYANPWTPNTIIPKDTEGKLDPNADVKIAKRIQSLVNLSRLVDHKMQLNSSGQEVPGASSISGTWEAIIEGANALPPKPINDPVLIKALEKASKLLTRPNPDNDPIDPDDTVPSLAYEKYKEYSRKYYKEVQNYASKYLETMVINPGVWPVTGRAAVALVDSAFDEWKVVGKKMEVEAAINLISAQGGDAVTKIISASKNNIEKFKIPDGVMPVTVPYVQIFPSNWCDAASPDDGWTTYRFDFTNYKADTSIKESSWGGSAGINMGFWSAGGGVSHSQAEQARNMSQDKLYIRFSYAIVQIERPFLNTILLNMGNWFLRGFKKNTISTGKVDQKKPANNEAFWLPSIPTQMFVIKDLFISTSSIKEAFKASQSATAVKASFGWGPFKIGANYSKKEQNASFESQEGHEGISVKGVQIMGWISQVLSASPQMDSPN